MPILSISTWIGELHHGGGRDLVQNWTHEAPPKKRNEHTAQFSSTHTGASVVHIEWAFGLDLHI